MINAMCTHKSGAIIDSIFQNFLSWLPIEVYIRLPNYYIEVWRSKLLFSFLTISISAHTIENVIKHPQLNQFWCTVTIEILSQEILNFCCLNSFVRDAMAFSKQNVRLMRAIIHAILQYYLIYRWPCFGKSCWASSHTGSYPSTNKAILCSQHFCPLINNLNRE